MAETLPTAPLLTKADLPEIIQRYLNGESIQTIATNARATRQTIYNWMHKCDGSYFDLVTDAMICRLADADDQLASAASLFDIARAREECRYTRWDLERRRPQLFGQKIESKTDVNITVVVQQLPSTPLPVVMETVPHASVEDVSSQPLDT